MDERKTILSATISLPGRELSAVTKNWNLNWMQQDERAETLRPIHICKTHVPI